MKRANIIQRDEGSMSDPATYLSGGKVLFGTAGRIGFQ
jgi:hypothetical protein